MKQQSLWKWCSAIIALAFGIFTYLSAGSPATAQQSITSGFTYSQNFDIIGTSATAALPTNWRIDKQGAVRTIGTWAAAVTATEFRAGNSMGTTASNGIYNYGAGPAATATDRALGWISSSTGTDSGNLYLYLQNNAPINNLGSVQIAYDVEKYRNGSNPAGYRIQMYYSYNGSSWTDAGVSFLTSFAADANNNGFASAPGSTTPVNATLTFASPIPPGGDVYLAWNYSVPTGSTVTNAQGLGIDNFQISDPRQPNAVQVVNISARSNGTIAILPLTILGLIGLTGAWLILRRRSRAA
jgi:hypothetical protein